jgi:hypothetical protein
MNDLVRAAQVFNFTIPEWLEDDVIVGKICGTAIHAGEIRRLSKGLEVVKGDISPADAEILALIRADRRIEAIKYRRILTHEFLKEAKDYVEQLGVRHGLLTRNSDGFLVLINTPEAS